MIQSSSGRWAALAGLVLWGVASLSAIPAQSQQNVTAFFINNTNRTVTAVISSVNATGRFENVEPGEIREFQFLPGGKPRTLSVFLTKNGRVLRSDIIAAVSGRYYGAVRPPVVAAAPAPVGAPVLKQDQGLQAKPVETIEIPDDDAEDNPEGGDAPIVIE